VNTEITDNKAKQPAAGWVCYDGDCALCRRWSRRVECPLHRHGFNFVPLQTPWVNAQLNLSAAELLKEMRLLLPDGRVIGGADAAVVLMQYVWWLWPLWLLSRLPGAMSIFRVTYRYIAKNRHCHQNQCQLGKETPP